MGEPTNQTSCPSGPEQYVFNGTCIKIAPCFIYEVSAHKYWKNGYCFLGDKYYKSDRLLRISSSHKVSIFNGYKIVKEIVLLGAPEGFIKEMGLPLFVPTEPKVKTKKKNGTRRVTKRPVC